MNETRGEIIKHCLLGVCGLAVYATGVYLTIQANIGVAPWDCLFLGIEKTFGIKYGNAAVSASLLIICIDWSLKQRIGLGTFIDALVTGKIVDLLDWLEIVPPQESVVMGVLLMIAGLFLNGLGQFLYMRLALSCGPRDGLIVGLSKKFERIPIGAISVFILAVVLFFGWILGGPIGIGTLISVFLTGPIMQFVFRLVHFEAETVPHQDIFTSLRVLLGKGK